MSTHAETAHRALYPTGCPFPRCAICYPPACPHGVEWCWNGNRCPDCLGDLQDAADEARERSHE